MSAFVQEFLHRNGLASDVEDHEVAVQIPALMCGNRAQVLYDLMTKCAREQRLPPFELAAINGLSEVDETEEKQKWLTAITSAFNDGPRMLRINVSEPYLSNLRDRTKSIECRLLRGAYTDMSEGDVIVIDEKTRRRIATRVVYKGFYEMLCSENLASVLPGQSNVAEGVQIYSSFYSEEEQQKYSVVAWRLSEESDDEPSHCHPSHEEKIRWVLEVLGKRGVGALLGMRRTAGTAQDLLPPCVSLLIDAFQLRHSSSSKSPILTVGARALAKHCHRSRDGWWLQCVDTKKKTPKKKKSTSDGECSDDDASSSSAAAAAAAPAEFIGTEAEKNQAALCVLQRILAEAIWANIHQLPPYEFAVLEIRNAIGYGARWRLANSEDDSIQFRGFLEPQLEMGHECKWRH